MLPEHIDAVVDRSGLAVPSIFTEIARLGSVAPEEMDRVFNMGVGMILSVDAVAADDVLRSLGASGVAAAIFISQGIVIWPQTLALMAGSIIGGQLGASIARVAPREVMRIAVTAVGALLTCYFAWHYWF